MSLHKIVSMVLMVLGLLVMPQTGRCAETDVARATVQAAVDEGLATFVGKTIPVAERTRLLDNLLRRYVDPPMLSASILGRYWGKITPAEQSAFSELFIRYLVTSYVGMLGRAEEGVRMQLGQAQVVGSRVKVLSEAFLPAEPVTPIPVEWDVATTPDGKPVIMDLTAQGISLIRAMRDDFASVLRSSGGKIEPLMDALQRKIDENERLNAGR